MKIAYLISAYTDEHQLFRLIKRLEEPDTYFFVHLDKNVKWDLPSRKKLLFINERYYVSWGGWSQVLYQKALLKSCINSGINFDRVIIISAQDYPIVPNKKITQDFSSFPQKQYIKAQRLESSQIKKQQDKVRVYHFCRDIRVPHNIKRFVVWLLRVVMTALPIRKKLYFTNGNKKYDIYQGSSYMALTFDCAKYVYSQMSSNTKFMRYLRWSYIPEELVIPTIVFNSEYGHNAEMASGDRLVERSAITYFDYGKKVKVFSLSDYTELKTSGKMFARKMETGTSDTLMDKLDEENETFHN